MNLDASFFRSIIICQYQYPIPILFPLLDSLATAGNVILSRSSIIETTSKIVHLFSSLQTICTEKTRPLECAPSHARIRSLAVHHACARCSEASYSSNDIQIHARYSVAGHDWSTRMRKRGHGYGDRNTHSMAVTNAELPIT